MIGSFLVGLALSYRPFQHLHAFLFFFLKLASMARVPYNALLTNLACRSCTGEYWFLVIFIIILYMYLAAFSLYWLDLGPAFRSMATLSQQDVTSTKLVSSLLFRVTYCSVPQNTSITLIKMSLENPQGSGGPQKSMNSR